MVIGQFSERCSLVNTIDFGAATSDFTEESYQLVSKGKLRILNKKCSVVAVAFWPFGDLRKVESLVCPTQRCD